MIPLITLTDDIINDDDDIIDEDDDDDYSIEELENAVFSETEDGNLRLLIEKFERRTNVKSICI